MDKNIEKSKAMVYTPLYIWGKWGYNAYKRQAAGDGATYMEKKRVWLSCAECGILVTK